MLTNLDEETRKDKNSKKKFFYFFRKIKIHNFYVKLIDFT